MKSLKAQVGVEFLTYSIVFLIAMGVMLSVISILGLDLIGFQKSSALKKTTERIANSLLLVESQQEGFSYTMELDSTIAGYPFKVVFYQESVFVALLEENSLSSNEISVYSIKIPLTTYTSSYSTCSPSMNKVELLSPTSITFVKGNGCIEIK